MFVQSSDVSILFSRSLIQLHGLDSGVIPEARGGGGGGGGEGGRGGGRRVERDRGKEAGGRDRGKEAGGREKRGGGGIRREGGGGMDRWSRRGEVGTSKSEGRKEKRKNKSVCVTECLNALLWWQCVQYKVRVFIHSLAWAERWGSYISGKGVN